REILRRINHSTGSITNPGAETSSSSAHTGEAAAAYLHVVKLLLERSAPVLFDSEFGSHLLMHLVVAHDLEASRTGVRVKDHLAKVQPPTRKSLNSSNWIANAGQTLPTLRGLRLLLPLTLFFRVNPIFQLEFCFYFTFSYPDDVWKPFENGQMEETLPCDELIDYLINLLIETAKDQHVDSYEIEIDQPDDAHTVVELTLKVGLDLII
ncbi:unnamed protein product, partial [Protopolystoma xenopodis]